MSTQEYSIEVKDGKTFTPSSCTCKECIVMHISQVEWDTFIPQTHLQRRMKEVIKNIEMRSSLEDTEYIAVNSQKK